MGKYFLLIFLVNDWIEWDKKKPITGKSNVNVNGLRCHIHDFLLIHISYHVLNRTSQSRLLLIIQSTISHITFRLSVFRWNIRCTKCVPSDWISILTFPSLIFRRMNEIYQSNSDTTDAANTEIAAHSFMRISNSTQFTVSQTQSCTFHRRQSHSWLQSHTVQFIIA